MVYLSECSGRTSRPILIVLGFALLGTIFITPGTLGQDNYVEGIVYGVWSRELSPYYVTDDILVPDTSELYIRSGVEVKFMGNYAFEVHGMLWAAGDTVEGNRILMTSELPIPWWGLSFINCEVQSIVVNCDIVNVWTGIECVNSDVYISGNWIDARNVAINCVDASPEIRDNHLIVRENNNINASLKVISLHNRSNPLITGNVRIECIANASSEAYGIYIRERSSPTIEKNWIEVRSNYRAVGIDARDLSNLNIKRNIIRAKSIREMKGFEASDAAWINFINNDVILMGTCIDIAVGLMLNHGSGITITNNIILGNDLSIGLIALYGTVNPISGYNDFFRHAENYIGEWQGNNDIHVDPLFSWENDDPNLANYHLTRGSPCIDAGDPGYPLEDDSTRIDIGRYWFDQREVYAGELPPATEYLLLAAHPNPFNLATTLTFSLPSAGSGRLALYDLNGRKLQTIWSGMPTAGSHRILWQATGYPAGEYIIRLESTAGMESYKLVLLP